MDALPYRLTVLVLVSFLGLSVVSTWPLSAHLGTHLTGLPTGDAGVYVWNIWLFRHQLVEQGQSPFWTTAVLPLAGSTNLALHNYTVFADLLAVPLQSAMGVVAAFNVVYLVNVALCGVGMFLLARRATGTVLEAWVAGAMFALAPFLVARGASHFSLAAAAPLPFFMYFFDRAWSAGRLRDAAAAGFTMAWAFYCDPYYAVYTAMLGGVFTSSRLLTFRWAPSTPDTRTVLRVTDALIAALGVIIVSVSVIGGGSVSLGSASFSIRSLYTPMLLLSGLIAMRCLWRLRVSAHLDALPSDAGKLAFVLVLSATLALAPALHALAALAASDQLVSAPVLWRSSAPGVDLLSFFLPNPNHPLAPDVMTTWLAQQPGRFDENVVSLSYVALAALFGARRWADARMDPMWLAVTLGFLCLALGPFVSVAGVATYVPTPWTFLRYVPVIGEARMPQRFGIVVFLGLTVLFAAALTALGRAFPSRRRLMVGLVALALTIELLPVPRRLASADVPAVYTTIADDPRPLRVLDVPFGVRDGLSSFGDFNASSLVYQTVHRKELLGGYLSRVDERTKRVYERDPMLRALMDMSADTRPSADTLAAARAGSETFVSRAHLGYVVIDRSRTSDALERFTIDALALEPIATSGTFALYATPLAAR